MTTSTSPNQKKWGKLFLNVLFIYKLFMKRLQTIQLHAKLQHFSTTWKHVTGENAFNDGFLH